VQQEIAVALAIIVAGGVGAQWLSARVRLPSILFLLVIGVLAGPVTGLVDPAEMFGDALFPAVGVAVALLLFDGGLGLRFRHLDTERKVIGRLVTVGLLVTWAVGVGGAMVLLDLSGDQAVLLGAILTVSGPTVVIPLIEQIRPRERISLVIRWEGILIDPLGAGLSVVVLDAVLATDEPLLTTALLMMLTVAVGTAIGVAAGWGLSYALRRHWIPDRLQVSVALALVVAAAVTASWLRPEAGLFAATVAGIVVANQRMAPASHIVAFGESIGILILGSLFVVLGASVEPGSLADVAPEAIALTLVLLFVARPLAVACSTLRSDLTRRERAWLMTVAPRGIVAAAVSALFAIELAEEGHPFPELAPVTFIVICGTVLSSTIFGNVGARVWRVKKEAPRGLAIVGVNPATIALAHTLSDEGVPLLLIDPDVERAESAVAAGLLVYDGSTRSEDLHAALAGIGVRQALAVAESEALNRAVIPKLSESLGRANVFYLPPDPVDESEGEAGVAAEAWGRRPFAQAASRRALFALYDDGGSFDVITGAPLEGDVPLLRTRVDGVVEVLTPGWDRADLETRGKLVVLRPSDGTVEPAAVDGR
jgi:CPA1 family monovalent cation:H+ antiporter